jgi:hypothetical protein
MRCGSNFANDYREALIIKLQGAPNLLSTPLFFIDCDIRRVEYAETKGSILKEFKLISLSQIILLK